MKIEYFTIGKYYQIQSSDLPPSLQKEFPYGTNFVVLSHGRKELNQRRGGNTHLYVLDTKQGLEYCISMKSIVSYFNGIEEPFSLIRRDIGVSKAG